MIFNKSKSLVEQIIKTFKNFITLGKGDRVSINDGILYLSYCSRLQNYQIEEWIVKYDNARFESVLMICPKKKKNMLLYIPCAIYHQKACLSSIFWFAVSQVSQT